MAYVGKQKEILFIWAPVSNGGWDFTVSKTVVGTFFFDHEQSVLAVSDGCIDHSLGVKTQLKVIFRVASAFWKSPPFSPSILDLHFAPLLPFWKFG